MQADLDDKKIFGLKIFLLHSASLYKEQIYVGLWKIYETVIVF